MTSTLYHLVWLLAIVTNNFIPLLPALANYPDLWSWSVDHYDLFWEELFQYTHIIHSTPYDEVRIYTPPPGPTHTRSKDLYHLLTLICRLWI